ncbi:MAG: FctA domain-containing protein [Lachnospiraceae bacterium]|nr:FctA domain-containing protein [Lachnospiraceae bacterium]
MKKRSKRFLAAAVAAMMVVGSALPVLATEDPGVEASKATKVQITKTLKIGQGIAVPSETFRFQFNEVTEQDAEELGEEGTYIVPGASQAGGGEYPDLNSLAAKVAYTAATRTADGTDEELTLMSQVLDMADSRLTWDVPGMYIYSVNEIPGNTAGMIYDEDAKYYLKVFVKNVNGEAVVDSVAVFGQDENGDWVKVDGAPTDVKEPGTSGADDGCDDFAGNDFLFVNTYKKLVDKHPTNPNPASKDDPDEETNPGAFKLTKDVVGDYANQAYGFDFKVSIQLPETFSDYGEISATVNGYTANIIENVDTHDESAPAEVLLDADTEYDIYLRHGDSFVIAELPAGTIVNVEEQASNMKYVPTYTGKWGGDLTVARTGNGEKGGSLKSDSVVIGENGGFVQFTNTLNDSDVTATGIFINNLPYILMVGIALAGICLFTVSKRRRSA